MPWHQMSQAGRVAYAYVNLALLSNAAEKLKLKLEWLQNWTFFLPPRTVRIPWQVSSIRAEDAPLAPLSTPINAACAGCSCPGPRLSLLQAGLSFVLPQQAAVLSQAAQAMASDLRRWCESSPKTGYTRPLRGARGPAWQVDEKPPDPIQVNGALLIYTILSA